MMLLLDYAVLGIQEIYLLGNLRWEEYPGIQERVSNWG